MLTPNRAASFGRDPSPRWRASNSFRLKSSEYAIGISCSEEHQSLLQYYRKCSRESPLTECCRENYDHGAGRLRYSGSMAQTSGTTVTDAIQRLRLFNEKADTVRRGSFLEKVSRDDHGVTLHLRAGAPLSVEKRGVDEEATLALALTLRFFVQPRDGISLQQVAQVYESIPVPTKYSQSARSAADSVERFLDQPTGLVFQNSPITNRRLFEVFMYGGLAHANDDKRDEFERWTRGPFREMMYYYFEDIAEEIIGVVRSFYNMNERTIAFLETGILPVDAPESGLS